MHFFNQNFNIKMGGVHYMWVYLCTCVGILKNTRFVGCALYVGIYGEQKKVKKKKKKIIKQLWANLNTVSMRSRHIKLSYQNQFQKCSPSWNGTMWVGVATRAMCACVQWLSLFVITWCMSRMQCAGTIELASYSPPIYETRSSAEGNCSAMSCRASVATPEHWA